MDRIAIAIDKIDVGSEFSFFLSRYLLKKLKRLQEEKIAESSKDNILTLNPLASLIVISLQRQILNLTSSCRIRFVPEKECGFVHEAESGRVEISPGNLSYLIFIAEEFLRLESD